MAVVHAALGQTNEALACLQKGFDDHDGPMGEMKVEPLLDPLRFDPHFQDILRRMNLPP